MKKRGISPVVATVLLVAMVIVIALTIFLWFRGIAGETCTKFGGTNVEIVCNDVGFTADYSGGMLYFTNTENVPIYSLKVQINEGNSYRTMDINDVTDSWPSTGLNSGGSFSGNTGTEFDNAESITIIPVLMGTCGGAEKAYTCGDQHGYEIPIF